MVAAVSFFNAIIDLLLLPCTKQSNTIVSAKIKVKIEIILVFEFIVIHFIKECCLLAVWPSVDNLVGQKYLIKN